MGWERLFEKWEKHEWQLGYKKKTASLMGQCFLNVTGVQAPRRMSKINVVLGAWSKSLKKALHSSVFWAPMPRRKLTSRALEQTQRAAATPGVVATSVCTKPTPISNTSHSKYWLSWSWFPGSSHVCGYKLFPARKTRQLTWRVSATGMTRVQSS